MRSSRTPRPSIHLRHKPRLLRHAAARAKPRPLLSMELISQAPPLLPTALPAKPRPAAGPSPRPLWLRLASPGRYLPPRGSLPPWRNHSRSKSRRRGGGVEGGSRGRQGRQGGAAPQARPAACASARQSQSAGPAGGRPALQPRATAAAALLQVPRPSRRQPAMATPPKRLCPSLSTSSEGTRIKKISIEGNIGKAPPLRCRCLGVRSPSPCSRRRRRGGSPGPAPAWGFVRRALGHCTLFVGDFQSPGVGALLGDAAFLEM